MEIFLEIVRKPAIIIAIVTFLGLVFTRNKATKVVSGTIIAFVGFTMIKLGSHILGDVLKGFSKLFNEAFNLSGVVPSNEAVMSKLLADLGSTASFVLVVGLVVNILVARFTPFKAVYLSLHLALFSAFAITAVFARAAAANWITVVAGGILLGLYMAISPSIIAKYTKDVVNSDDYTIAHSGTLAYFLGSFLASKFGNKERDAEDIKVNDRILFLKDPNVATMLTMFILFFVSSIVAGGDTLDAVLSDLAGKDVHANLLIFSLEEAAKFAGGLFIVKAGIKLFIDELVPAFKGFAKVFAPGAIPGVDVLVLFDRSPNTALIGFLTSFLTGVVMIFVLPLFGYAVIVPGLMACFITGGAAAILGNAQGGLRGAIIASVTDGLLLSVLPAVCLPMFTEIFAKHEVAGTTFADPDMLLLATIVFIGAVVIPGLFGAKAAAAAKASKAATAVTA
ncbi:PTS ascorbate transporter subunit IIC [Actinomyces vulturis]|uniref:PTS ascorbate transporter subunit IIC n=1 Tax=Actinomyces vulturis TaxID=1857645 RepID=UPI0009F72130|nr:PTS ascorbate transporter subunit IIC [Actinomyces vulturis]